MATMSSNIALANKSPDSVFAGNVSPGLRRPSTNNHDIAPNPQENRSSSSLKQENTVRSIPISTDRSNPVISSTPYRPTANYVKQTSPTPNLMPIAPAIAPKKVLPKLSPHPSLQAQPIQKTTSTLTQNGSVNSNKTQDASPFIMTSKQWVLPPRPKPGRKPNDHVRKKPNSGGKSSSPSPPPASSHLMNHSNVQKLNNTSMNQKHSPTSNSSMSGNTSLHSTTAIKDNTLITDVTASNIQSKLNNRKNALAKKRISSASPGIPLVPKASDSSSPPELRPLTRADEGRKSENYELKLELLNKLKENENLKSLIDTLKLEINNLNFLQNGCINLKILNKNNDLSTSSTRERTNKVDLNFLDNLDKIENINDLNQLSEKLAPKNNFNYQDLESILNETLKTINGGSNEMTRKKIRTTSEFISNENELSKRLKSSFPQPSSTNGFKLERANTYPMINTIDEADEFLFNYNDIDENSDFEDNNPQKIATEQKLSYKNGRIFKRITPILNSPKTLTAKFTSNLTTGLTGLNQSFSPTNSILGGKFKSGFINCGFCSNDTPCLCLEAEYELNSVRDLINNGSTTSSIANELKNVITPAHKEVKIEEEDEVMSG